MRAAGVPPHPFAHGALFRMYAADGQWERAREALEEVRLMSLTSRNQFKAANHVYQALFKWAVEAGSLDRAEQLLGDMQRGGMQPLAPAFAAFQERLGEGGAGDSQGVAGGKGT